MKLGKVLEFGKAMLGNNLERVAGNGLSGPVFNVSISIGNKYENSKDNMDEI